MAMLGVCVSSGVDVNMRAELLIDIVCFVLVKIWSKTAAL